MDRGADAYSYNAYGCQFSRGKQNICHSCAAAGSAHRLGGLPGYAGVNLRKQKIGIDGKVETTKDMLSISNMNWAYSELFQTMDRGAMEWYLPRSIELAERCGPLIHFAETHSRPHDLTRKNRTLAEMAHGIFRYKALYLIYTLDFFRYFLIELCSFGKMEYNANLMWIKIVRYLYGK